MKNESIKTTLSAVLTVFAITAFAADSSSQQSSQENKQSQYNSNGNTSRQQRLSRDCSVSKILSADAKSKDGQDLGQISDVLVNPQTGKIDFVVLDKEGAQGTGEDRIPVPWKAVKAQPNGSVIINKSKSELSSAPTLKKDYSNLDEPYTVTIYEFYAVPVGGAESPGGQAQGSGSSTETRGSRTNQNGTTPRSE